MLRRPLFAVNTRPCVRDVRFTGLRDAASLSRFVQRLPTFHARWETGPCRHSQTARSRHMRSMIGACSGCCNSSMRIFRIPLLSRTWRRSQTRARSISPEPSGASREALLSGMCVNAGLKRQRSFLSIATPHWPTSHSPATSRRSRVLRAHSRGPLGLRRENIAKINIARANNPERHPPCDFKKRSGNASVMARSVKTAAYRMCVDGSKVSDYARKAFTQGSRDCRVGWLPQIPTGYRGSTACGHEARPATR
jgi:hypothetical protein